MTETVVNPNWIAVDWGTTNLRIWHCDQAGNVLDETKVQMGMGTLTASEYEGCLLYTSPSPRDLSTSRMPSSA